MRLSIVATAIYLSVVGLAAADNATAQVAQGNNPSASSFAENQAVNSRGNSNTSSNGLAEIIVTAEKRNERQQDVPASIQVLSGSKLEEEGVVQLSDYAKQIPGLNLIGASGA